MTMAPEFPRPLRLDTLGTAPRAVSIVAEAGERAALAERFGLISLDALAAEAEVRREGDDVFADGRVRGSVVQACVASGEPVPAVIDTPFRLRFVPEGAAPEADEVELDADDCDVVDYAGQAVDLGEAVAETLSLALDPFPRSPDAEAVLKAAGVKSEEEAVAEASPFAKLKGLLGE
ncbi:DUF177 domain-containing protein [Sphingomonas naphthae]|uniref:DUF177 domain-containing protein n=1 Tax=Sphingomonas naphthae TaxID=1813468 RepID=A0ABY7TIU0_9SPHN|nr:DUF177 domain-containing protein [Sphingomonas naphthae]WCT73142.1 DUF177 domain-containing protein [Sphingomonas naphthae]